MAMQEQTFGEQPDARQILSAGSPVLDYFEVGLSHREPQFLEALNQLEPGFLGRRHLVYDNLEADEVEWPQEASDLFLQTADQMGLCRTETPLIGEFGAVVAVDPDPLPSARYAAQALAGAQATAGEFIVAESPVTAIGRTVAQEYPGLAVAGMLMVNTAVESAEIIGAAAHHVWRRGLLQTRPAMAVVTRQLYQPAAALDLGRILRALDEDVRGFAAGSPSGPEDVAQRTPAIYLSTIICTLRAAALAIHE